MSIPKKHHFLPSFLLQYWAPTGKLVEFSRPHGSEVRHKKRHPNATGFQTKLYSIGNLQGALAEEIEIQFFSPLDSRSANVLSSLRAGHELSGEDRRIWAAFVLAMMTRMPSDVHDYKGFIEDLTDLITPRFRSIYELLALRDNNAPGFDDMAHDIKARSIDTAIKGLRRFMANEKIIDQFSAFEWAIIDVASSSTKLLISDRSVLHTTVFGNDQSHLLLPIGPTEIFVAAKTADALDNILNLGTDNIVLQLNSWTVGCADRYVFGDDLSGLEFIRLRTH